MATVETLIHDLQRLPPERWCVASYSRLVADPQSKIARLCRFLGLDQLGQLPFLFRSW